MIIKDRKRRDEKPDKCLRYAVCYDESAYAEKALALTLSLMRVEDKLTIVTVREFELSESQIGEKVRGEAAKHNVTKLEIVMLEAEPEKSTWEVLHNYFVVEAQDVNKHGYVDFVAVGNKGRNFDSKNTEKYLGATANALLRERRMNTIFIP